MGGGGGGADKEEQLIILMLLKICSRSTTKTTDISDTPITFDYG